MWMIFKNTATLMTNAILGYLGSSGDEITSRLLAEICDMLSDYCSLNNNRVKTTSSVLISNSQSIILCCEYFATNINEKLLVCR